MWDTRPPTVFLCWLTRNINVNGSILFLSMCVFVFWQKIVLSEKLCTFIIFWLFLNVGKNSLCRSFPHLKKKTLMRYLSYAKNVNEVARIKTLNLLQEQQLPQKPRRSSHFNCHYHLSVGAFHFSLSSVFQCFLKIFCKFIHHHILIILQCFNINTFKYINILLH